METTIKVHTHMLTTDILEGIKKMFPKYDGCDYDITCGCY